MGGDHTFSWRNGPLRIPTCWCLLLWACGSQVCPAEDSPAPLVDRGAEIDGSVREKNQEADEPNSAQKLKLRVKKQLRQIWNQELHLLHSVCRLNSTQKKAIQETSEKSLQRATETILFAILNDRLNLRLSPTRRFQIGLKEVLQEQLSLAQKTVVAHLTGLWLPRQTNP